MLEVDVLKNPNGEEYKRYACGVSYAGQTYSGWQRQPGLKTIQETLELALSKVADHPIEITCAGRTDARVHASQQIVHFNSLARRDVHAWLRGTNTFLPKDISLQWVQPVAQDFHARFSAIARRYWYLVYNAAIPPTMFSEGITWYSRPLCIDKMQQAAQYFIGEHDFSAFRSAECQSKSSQRRVFYLSIRRLRNHVILFDICANAFLQHMVRNMVGSLMTIGCGQQPVGWILELLRQKQRALAGSTAKPNGLYLVDVDYPKTFQLPAAEFIGPWFLTSF